MSRKNILKEFISFIRVENGLFTSGIAVSGFMIFNGIAPQMLPLFLAIFFGTVASYSFNYMKDKEEDIINAKRLNYFVTNSSYGNIIVISLYAAGFVFSFQLSPGSWSIYTGLMIFSVLYSHGLRIKEKFILKNIHTGLGIAISFLVGSTAVGFFSMTMIPYFAVVFMLGFAANVLGDVRGQCGDRSIGMITIPIKIGTEWTKNIINFILLCMLVVVMSLKQLAFYPLIPFVSSAMFFLSKDMLIRTRHSLLSSFAVMPVLLFIMTL